MKLTKIGKANIYEDYFINEKGELFQGSATYDAKPCDKQEAIEFARHSLKVNSETAELTKSQPFAHYTDSSYSIYSDRAEKARRLLEKLEA